MIQDYLYCMSSNIIITCREDEKEIHPNCKLFLNSRILDAIVYFVYSFILPFLFSVYKKNILCL